MNYVISASILSANIMTLEKEINSLTHDSWIHLDCMDNHFVPNLTFGPITCSAIKNSHLNRIIDTHIMAKPVDDLIISFAKAGSNRITIHPESTNNLLNSINLIKSFNCKVGIAISPGTKLSVLNSIIEDIDLILIMTVNPGFSGQKIIPEVFNKISTARELITQSQKLEIRLQVDGGVNSDNIKHLATLGADTFVLGNHIFKNKPYSETIRQLLDKLP